MNTQVIVIFILYVLMMIGIGVLFYKRNNTIKDYVLGGRSLNPWVTAMSAQASDMSGWLLTGLPGLAYVSLAGTKEAVWTAIGLGLGTYLNWLFVAKRFRAYTEAAGDSLTMPTYFESRFRVKSKALKIICALFILFFFLIYTASMFVAGAKLFVNVFGISYGKALALGAIVIITYTTLGGFLAVSWTDFIQGILMFCSLVAVPLIMIFKDPRVPSAEGLAAVKDGFFNIFPDSDFSGLVIASALAWGLGYFGQPHILARFMGIKKPSGVRPARVISMVWVIISMAGALMVGMVGKVFFAENPLADKETVFMDSIQALCPPILAGILLSAILAAIMSTADSQLLVSSSAFANDIYAAFDKKASDKKLMWISRGSVIVISLIAVAIASNPDSEVFGIVSYAWAGFGAAFGPAVLFSIFWKRMNAAGVYAGIISGGLSTIIFHYLGTLNIEGFWGKIFGIYEILPAFIISSILIVAVSLLTKAPSEEIQQEFEKAKQLANAKD